MALYKRGLVYHYDFSFAGERFRGSTEETVLSRARKIEALKMVEARDRGGSLLPRRAPVLGDFSVRFLKWVEAAPLEPKTRTYYKNGWQMLAATPIRGMRLDRITRDEAEMLALPGSPQNANRALRTLRRMLGKAAEWGLIRNPPRIKLRKEYGRDLVIDHASEAKLLARARQPLKDVLLLVLDAGMRPGEVFRIRWEHIQWEMRSILVPYGKTRNARRFVPMTHRVMAALATRRKGQTEGWVFPSKRKASAGHLTTVARAFRALRQKLGLSSKLVLYSARHTFGTRVLAGTGNLAAVMKAMGHASAQTAMIYQHPSLDLIRQAVEESEEIPAMSQTRHKLVLLQ